MLPSSRRSPFLLFFLSGFAGLVYQIVWLRLAFAAFGVVTPVISVVLSVFMFGLGVGSWVSGTVLRYRPWSRGTARLRAYAAAEFLIGVGGLTVPRLFTWAETALLPAGDSDSATYLLASAASILLALSPFCLCMGVTFPLMMQALRAERSQNDSFSFLYLANVLGAMCGTLLTPLLLVEVLGFRGALAIGCCANWIAALVSLRMSFSAPAGVAAEAAELPQSVTDATVTAGASDVFTKFPLWVLFTTGLTSMGMEVVWTRAFVPVLKTQVYSFASLLFTYLLATWCGSALYRRELAKGRSLATPLLLSLLSLAAFAQLLQADPRFEMPRNWIQAGWLLMGIVPYCALLGYLTPKLIDEYSQGRPGPAGRAYAINVLGCIIGPLLVSYLLLPRLGVQSTGLVLAVPLWILAGAAVISKGSGRQKTSEPAEAEPAAPLSAGRSSLWPSRLLWGAAAGCGVLTAAVGTSYEDRRIGDDFRLFRDHTATVIAATDKGAQLLVVNGTLLAYSTPTTKIMAHLPLTYVPHPPRSAMVICFGMGVTYRSLLSWEIDVTAVELVPSVRDAFGYFFEDADEYLQDPRGRIIIDDGRRYLKRTTDRFDVITLDPPPPSEAAGSSLLYSREFYQLIKPRLADGGILHQFSPGGEVKTFQAVLRALVDEFPHVQAMPGYNGGGFHLLASMEPLPEWTAAELAARLPEAARRDLVEWTPDLSAEELLNLVVSKRLSVDDALDPDPRIVITDDQPYNEFYVLRRAWRFLTERSSSEP